MNFSGSTLHAPQYIRAHLFISIGPNRDGRSNNGPMRNDLRMPEDFFSILLDELCARPGEYPYSWFDPTRVLRLCAPGLDCADNFISLN